MRRAVRLTPFAPSATATRRLACLGAVLAIAAVVLSRRGLEPVWSLVLLTAGLVLALSALLAAFVAAVAIWRTGHKGTGRMATGALVAGLTLAYPLYLAALFVRVMPPVDVTTDVDHPPETNPPRPIGSAIGRDLAWVWGQSLTPRGDIDPVLVDGDPSVAHRAALKAVSQLHWRLVSSSPPSKRLPVGSIEAVAVTTVMWLPERILIRVAGSNGQSRIDLRAINETPYALIGSDLRHAIQAFADAIEAQEP